MGLFDNKRKHLDVMEREVLSNPTPQNMILFAERCMAAGDDLKALEVAKLEAELTVMRLKALSEVQPALSQEQLDKIMNPPQLQQGGNPDGENPRPGNRRMNRPQSPPGDDMEKPLPPKRERQ